MLSYDLIDQPFVSVLPIHGPPKAVGLREALTEAHTFREIRDPLPTVEFGLHRLLVALVLDIFFIEPGVKPNSRALREMLAQRRFDGERVERYFAEYGGLFDLFGEKPFLQTAEMTGEDKPVAGLLHLQPSGTNANHFKHGHEGEFALGPAAAARLLTTIAPFMTAGGAGLAPSINGAPPLYVLPTGDNLFETICKNVFVLDLQQKDNEPPAWRSDHVVGKERSGSSYAASLTWRPRRLLLQPGHGGICSLTGDPADTLIRTMKFGPGDNARFAWRDPNCAYRIEDKGATVQRLREGREIWRDTGPLALLTEASYGKDDAKVKFARPRVLDQLVEIHPERRPTIDLVVYGMRTDLKMKAFEWQREILSLPASLVKGRHFDRTASDAMERAERAAYSLRNAVKAAYPRDGKGNDKALNARVAEASRLFWNALRDPFGRVLLPGLAVLAPDDDAGITAARTEWENAVRCSAWGALELATDDFDSDDQALFRQTRARQQLKAGLFAAFDTADKKAARQERKQARGNAKETNKS